MKASQIGGCLNENIKQEYAVLMIFGRDLLGGCLHGYNGQFMELLYILFPKNRIPLSSYTP